MDLTVAAVPSSPCHKFGPPFARTPQRPATLGSSERFADTILHLASEVCERAVHLHEQQKANDAKKAAKEARKSAKNLLAGGDGAAPKKSSMCQVL